ncbi:hypothetical protein KC19_12G035700 [Ceratodon purpureus]|uniref:DUF2306 domain-containing protein n=1 Tax=Ceratodon purpureus TaxID=3225 RepID=A0A8T0G8Y7_CERPU|nr:hypothetical protein KC19_12G035700 [Ceratodon purpureus]
MEEVGEKRWMRTWGNLAWWIVTCYSVLFTVYTVPFVYGDFEIYKHFTLHASLGNYDLAGLNILHNLRAWQVHATAALLYMIIGPLQFNASFRNKYPTLHKRLGYTFSVCTVVVAVTGGTTLRLNGEIETPMAMPRLSPLFMTPASLIALVISINAARNKDFERHRRWILRSAAICYSVMYSRTLPFPIQLLFRKLSRVEALDYGIILTLLLNSGLAEIYIQTYLTKPAARKGTSMNQGAGHTPRGKSTKVF